ncbi:hypothetical protein BKA57DRAFT_441896 [Linnemannia elongata]|nr:hypothetical protein BKA57DRAFT_441896 [Linnemannia elongata]
MDKIDEWGIKATDSYNAAKKREHERAEASGRQVPPPVPVPWRCPSDEEHVRGFSSIGGAQSVYRGLPVPDRDLDPKWHVSDLLRGITPRACCLSGRQSSGPQSRLHRRSCTSLLATWRHRPRS